MRLKIWKAWCGAQAHQHKSVTSARRARQGHERACASVVTRSRALLNIELCNFRINEIDNRVHNHLYCNLNTMSRLYLIRHWRYSGPLLGHVAS